MLIIVLVRTWRDLPAQEQLWLKAKAFGLGLREHASWKGHHTPDPKEGWAEG